MGTPMSSVRPRARPRPASASRRQAQRGIIMILALISLVLLLIGVVAIIRTTDTATAVIGNLAFRRDLTNRAEVAIAAAKATLNSGGALYLETNRLQDSAANNYSAVRLANAQGIGVPAVLLSNKSYANAGYQCLPAGCTAGSDGVLMRWVIDRQCYGTSPQSTALAFDTSICAYLPFSGPRSGESQGNIRASGAARAVFRISVRVTGPRNTEAYIQTTAG
jgi:Tfp pilus assembly protein PilX